MRWIGLALLVTGWIALVYQLILNGSYAFLLVASARGVNRQRRLERYADHDAVARSPFTLPISIIVPAFNEVVTIVDSVEALRKLDYPEAEIVVVNDGSTDGTLDALIGAFQLRPARKIIRSSEPQGAIAVRGRIRGFFVSVTGHAVRDVLVVDKENGGKADALNVGILASRYPLCCTVDADSLLEPDSLLRAVRPFLDEPLETIAAGGLIRVANGSLVDKGRVVEVGIPTHPLLLAQVVEYFRSFLGARFGLASVGWLLVLSGAFSLFRRSVLVEAGGFRGDVLTEDMEITCALHRRMLEAARPYRITYVPDPVAWTEVPRRLGELGRQRMRWQRGLLEVLSIHRRLHFRPRYGVVGVFAFPYHLLFEGYGPVIEAAGYVIVPLGWAFGLIDTLMLVLFIAVSLLYGIVLSVFALFLQTRSRLPYERGLGLLALGALFEAIALRPVLAMFRAAAVVQHLAGRKQEWGRKERAGFAETPSS